MEIPMEVKPALLGGVCGAAALALIGFTWGGWVTGANAESTATQRAETAVVTVLAPICADNFKRASDAQVQLAALKRAKSWEQADFVQKGGWAKSQGSPTVDRALATACAEMIMANRI
jgi:alpha/beta superfamily hydrolase